MVSPKSTAHFASCVEGTKGSYDYLVSYIKDRLEPENSRYLNGMVQLIVHILDSMTHGTRMLTTGNDAIPIPYKLIRKLGGAIIWRLCVTHGLIGYIDYSSPCGDKKGKCREYFLTQGFADGYFDNFFSPDRLKDHLHPVDMRTGKPYRRDRKSDLINPVSRLPVQGRGAIEIVTESLKRPNIKAMLAEYRLHREEVLLTNDPVDLNRLRQVEISLSSVILHTDKDGYYHAVYKRSPMGRMYEKGAGMQSLPERYKYAAYGDDIEAGNIKNMDNDTCHPRIIRYLATGINKRGYARLQGLDWTGRHRASNIGLIDLSQLGHERYEKLLWSTFNEAGCDLAKIVFPFIPCNKEMKLYCTNRAYKKQVHADLLELAVPPYRCKTIITSIFYGLQDEGMNKIHLGHDQIAVIQKDYDWAYQTAFLVWTFILMACIDQYTRYRGMTIRANYPLGKVGFHAGDLFEVVWIPRRGVHVINKMGQSLLVIDTTGDFASRDDGRKVDGPFILCHILQGVESKLWDHIITSSKDHGYTITSPEHDGAVINVSGGEVPDEVYIEAIRKAGLGTAKAYGGKRTPKRIGNDACMIREKPFERVIKSRTPGRSEIAGMVIKKERPYERSSSRKAKVRHVWYLEDDIEVSAMEDSW